MQTLRSHQNHFYQANNNSCSQYGKHSIQRLRTNPSLFTKTIQTQDSIVNFGQTYQFSPQQFATSKRFNQKAEVNLSIHSRIKISSEIDKQSVESFLAEIKILKFFATRNQQTKHYLATKQKYLAILRLQVEQKEESIKYFNMKYQKKQQQFTNRRLKMHKNRVRKNKQMQQQLQELSLSIRKMKNKIKSRKLKTESMHYKNQNNSVNLRLRIALPPYHFPNIFPPQPQYYFQPPARLANINYNQHFPPIDNTYEWQNKLNQSNFQHQNYLRQKFKTQATYETKPNEQPLSTSRKRNPSEFQTYQNPNKVDRKVSQLRGSRKSYKLTESINMKNKKQQNLSYFNSNYESENEGRYLNVNNESNDKSKTTPVHIFNKEESQCFNYLRPQQSSSEQWMELMDQSKVKKSKINKNLVPQNVIIDTIKVPEDKSQRNSSKGSNFSNVNVTISSDDKNKQTVRSSSDESKKRSVVQSIVAISMSGMGSSKISKRSRTNSASENKTQIKQTNRYIPLLAKEFMKIQEQSDEVTSLKTTPNQFVTPRNTSINQKSIAPTNSQNKKKISVIQQQEQPFSPLKKPPALGTEKKDNQQFQNDCFLSKIRLNTQSKNFPMLTPIAPVKEDDDLLAGILLVGQSKISRLRSQSQRMSINQTKNDIDEIGQLKVNSQVRRQHIQQDSSSFDDFDFVLSGQSKITKKNKQMPNRMSLQQSPSNKTQERSRFSTGSYGFQLKDNTIEQKQQQYDEYPSNKADKKHTKKM